MENAFVEKVKSLAKENNTSVKLILEEIGLNAGFMTDLNRKRSSPSAENVLLFANYFNVSTDYLLGRDAADETVPSHLKPLYLEANDLNIEEAEDVEKYIQYLKSRRGK